MTKSSSANKKDGSKHKGAVFPTRGSTLHLGNNFGIILVHPGAFGDHLRSGCAAAYSNGRQIDDRARCFPLAVCALRGILVSALTPSETVTELRL